MPARGSRRAASAGTGETALDAPIGKPLAQIVYPGLALGILLFSALVTYHGIAEVSGLLAAAGTGLLGVALFHLVPMLLDALGWRSLFGAGERLPVRTMLRARWIGESVNGLLPVMQVGGNVAKARLLARRGVAGPAAGASVVVDVTLVVFSQVLFTLIGLCLLVIYLGGGVLAAPVLTGTMIMGSILVVFYLVQRRGLFGVLAGALQRVARGPDWTALTSGAAALDQAVRRLYLERGALTRASAWHLVSWLVGAGEVWLALHLLGHPVGLRTAVLLESLGQAVRAAAFAVPGALGVQEGGYLVLGSVLGVPADTALALSLAKRVRELVLGLPGLLAWQLEGAGAYVRAERAHLNGVTKA